MDRDRVLVVEDDDFTRAMLISSLKLEGLDVVGDSATVRGAINIMETLKPDIAIIDLHLGAGPTGLDLALSFRLRYPKLGIVLLTTYDDPRLLAPNLPALPLGAVYMVKRDLSTISHLIKAIEIALDNVGENVITGKQKFERANPVEDITDGQIETMRLLAHGLSNREIATTKGISEKSVEQSITRLGAQLGIKKDDSRNVRVQITNFYYQLTGSSNAAVKSK